MLPYGHARRERVNAVMPLERVLPPTGRESSVEDPLGVLYFPRGRGSPAPGPPSAAASGQ